MQEKLREFWKEHRIFICILILAIFLRIMYLGFAEFDEINYVTGAKHVLAGTYDPNIEFPTTHLRYTLVFFIAGYINIFGYEYPRLVPITLLPAIGSIIIVYLLGRKLRGEKTGLIAAFLLAIFPLNVKYSSFLEADIIVSFFIGLCALLYFYKQNKISFFFIGILIGVSFFIKFFNMLILLVILFHLIITKNLRFLIPLSLGFLIAITPFTIYQTVKTGDPLFHMNALETEIIQYNQMHYDDETFTQYIFNFASKQPEPSLFNIFPFLVLFFLWKYWRQITKQDLFFWFWLVAGYFILELHPNIPAIQRYLIIIEIPLIIISALLLEKIQNKTYLVLCLLLFFGVSMYQLGEPTINEPSLRNEEERVVHLLQNLPKKDIYITHYRQVASLEYYLDYQHNYSDVFGYHAPAQYTIYDLHYYHNLSEIRNAYVIIDYRFINESYDFLQYYQQKNVSIEYLITTPPPSYWHSMYGFTYNNKFIGGLWDVS